MEENKKLPEANESPANQEVKAKPEPVDRLDKPIGTKEPKMLEAKKVKIVDVSIQPQFKKGKEEPIGDMVVFMCQHPDKTELIKLSKVKYLKDDKLIDSGLWYNEDEDGNIAKLSALSKLIGFYKLENLKRFIGTEVETINNAAGYLTIKAF